LLGIVCSVFCSRLIFCGLFSFVNSLFCSHCKCHVDTHYRRTKKFAWHLTAAIIATVVMKWLSSKIRESECNHLQWWEGPWQQQCGTLWRVCASFLQFISNLRRLKINIYCLFLNNIMRIWTSHHWYDCR
jgi:hypothetical protein